MISQGVGFFLPCGRHLPLVRLMILLIKRWVRNDLDLIDIAHQTDNVGCVSDELYRSGLVQLVDDFTEAAILVYFHQ